MRACDTCLKLLTECPAKINCLGDADHYLEVKTSINITGLIVPVTDSAGCFVLQLNSSDTAFVYICCPPRRDHLRSRAPAGSLWTQAVLPPRPWQESLCCCLQCFAASQVSNPQGVTEALYLSVLAIPKRIRQQPSNRGFPTKSQAASLHWHLAGCRSRFRDGVKWITVVAGCLEFCAPNRCCYTFCTRGTVTVLMLVVQLQRVGKCLKHGRSEVVRLPATSHKNIVMVQASSVQKPGSFPAMLLLLMEKQEMQTSPSLMFSLCIYIS